MPYFKTGATVLVALALATMIGASESDELREEARAMLREAAELAERGHGEEAENHERKALTMLEEAEHLERHRPEHRDSEIREMRERLEVLRSEERELEEIGSQVERLRDVRREAEIVERELHEISHDRRHDEDSPEGMARRLEHMRAAVDHLHHAGLQDIANQVVESAEATERALHERHGHHDAGGLHAIMQQLEEIRHEVERLRDEVNELKERR